jgi:hypothetical protein
MFSKRFALFASDSALARVAGGSTAEASHDLFARVSAGEVNGNGDNINTSRGASADGSRVFLRDQRAADSDRHRHLRGHLWALRRDGELISTGSQAFNSFFEDASANGSRVVFSTLERLSPNDTDSAFDLYGRSGGTTTLVTEGEINGNGDFPAPFFGASADGSRIFFGSSEQLVPSDTDSDFDLYQRSQGVTRRVSVGEVNGNGAFPAIFRGASADGSSVIFDTREQLVLGDTDDSIDAYKRSAGTTSLVTGGNINGNGPFDTSFRAISRGGYRSFFETNEQLDSADMDGSRDLYERSSGAASLVSTGDVGGNGPNDAFFAGLGADGSRVFFQTDEQLTFDDQDGNLDIYERSGGITRLISAWQINGNGNFNASSCAPRTTARGCSSSRTSRSIRPTWTEPRISTSASAGRRCSSPQEARTSPSTPSEGPRRTAPVSSSRPTSSSSRTIATSPRTNTSGC